MKRAGAEPVQELMSDLNGCAGPTGLSASVPFWIFPGKREWGLEPPGHTRRLRSSLIRIFETTISEANTL